MKMIPLAENEPNLEYFIACAEKKYRENKENMSLERVSYMKSCALVTQDSRKSYGVENVSCKRQRRERARWDVVGTLEQCIAFQCSKYLKKCWLLWALQTHPFLGGGEGKALLRVTSYCIASCYHLD
jgi:hypothetical protein